MFLHGWDVDKYSRDFSGNSAIECVDAFGAASRVSKALYLVIFSRETWWVDLEGTAYGPFPSLQDATEEGRQLAQMCAHAGRPCEVLIPDDRGRYRVVWDSDKEMRSAGGYSSSAA